MIFDELMSYVPFQRMHAVYLEYATWLEEFHLQDYIDQSIAYFNRYYIHCTILKIISLNNCLLVVFIKRVKQEAKDRFNAMTARYQPLIDPFIQAVQGRLDALKQMPLFAYLTKAFDRMSQQLAEFSKFAQMEVELRQVLRQVLQHTDRLTTQLVADLKVRTSFISNKK